MTKAAPKQKPNPMSIPSTLKKPAVTPPMSKGKKPAPAVPTTNKGIAPKKGGRGC